MFSEITQSLISILGETRASASLIGPIPMLRYHVQTDNEIVKRYLETSNKNSTCISKPTQNQLIEIIGKPFLKQVIEEVKQAKFCIILSNKTSKIRFLKIWFFSYIYFF